MNRESILHWSFAIYPKIIIIYDQKQSSESCNLLLMIRHRPKMKIHKYVNLSSPTYNGYDTMNPCSKFEVILMRTY